MNVFTRSFVFLFLSFLQSLTAQEVPEVVAFGRGEYHAAHQNWSIVQDCDGYLYVANTDGVLLFNGFQWQLIRLPKRQKPRTLYKGKDCKVYVAGYEFFGYIDNTRRSTPTYIPLADDELQQSNQEIWNIIGNDDKIYLQSFSNFYEYQQGTLVSVTVPTNIMLGNSVNGKVLLPKIENGIYSLEQGQFVNMDAADAFPDGAKIAALESYGSESTLIGTQYHGLFLLSEGRLTAVGSPLNDVFKREQINKILRLRNGDFAIGTILGGLYVTTPQLQVKMHISKGTGLSNNTVLSLFESESRDLWIGLDQGINLLKLSSVDRYYYDESGQLGSVFTSKVYNGILYLGTNQGLFRRNSDGKFSLVPSSQGQIWSMLEVDGDLLVGHNTGTYHLLNGEFVQVSDVTGGWSMSMLGSGRILQTTYTGLVLLEKKGKKWQLEQRVENGGLLVSEAVVNGHQLIGHHSNYGICKLDLSDDFTKVIDRKVISEVQGQSVLEDVQLTLAPEPGGFIVNGKVYVFEGNEVNLVGQAELPLFEKSLLLEQRVRNLTKKFALTNTDYIDKANGAEPLLVGVDEGYLVSYQKQAEENKPAVDYVLTNGEEISAEALSFAPSKNDVAIYLKDLTYGQRPGSTMCRVTGWDDDWFLLPPTGVIELLNLDNGAYQLETSSGSSQMTLLSFDIEPYWYESWLGGILYVSLGMLLLFLARKYSEKKLRLQEHTLMKEKEREVESAIIKEKNVRLEREVKYKSKMLANSTMTLVQKNRMLADLKEVIQHEASKIKTSDFPRQKLYNLIDTNINSENDWEIFEKNFAAVHENFLDKLKEICPDITAGELKLAAYIKMDLASKEIAPLLNISVRSIENKRYRLRKKLNILHENTLKEYLSSL